MKKLICLILIIFITTGCSLFEKITFKKISLEDTIVALNKLDSISMNDEGTYKEIKQLPIIETNLEKVDIKIDSTTRILHIDGHLRNDFYCLDMFKQEEQYYLVTWSYRVKSDDKAIYTPIGFTKETVYLANEDIYTQLKNATI